MSHPPEPSDDPDRLYERLLVVRCQSGDRAAFVELVGRYQPRLGYFVWKMLGRPGGSDRTHLVDDLLQDVWLDVLRGLPRLADAAAFPAWVYRIARDRVYRELRRLGRPGRGGPAEVPIGDLEPTGPAGDAADEAEFDEADVALVHEALDELSPPHREVLVLRFLQGMSYEDVARVAGCEVGTVRSRLHYAKAALRRVIETLSQRFQGSQTPQRRRRP